MKNRFYKPDPAEKLYKDKISGYIIWEGLTRQEHGIPDWRVAKNRYRDYERGGTLKECKQYLEEKFPIPHWACKEQEKYILNQEDVTKIIDRFTDIDGELNTDLYNTSLIGLTIRKAAKKTNPDFHKEEMDHMIAAITGVEGIITPEYL